MYKSSSNNREKKKKKKKKKKNIKQKNPTSDRRHNTPETLEIYAANESVNMKLLRLVSQLLHEYCAG